MRFLSLFIRFIRRLFGAAPSNADVSALTEIGGTGEPNMTITLRMGQAPRSFRVVPNKGDNTVEDVTSNVSGGAEGDAYVGKGAYVSEPGNPLAFTLAALAPTSVGAPSILNWSFDSATEAGETQTVTGSAEIIVLPENADGSELQEIV